MSHNMTASDGVGAVVHAITIEDGLGSGDNLKHEYATIHALPIFVVAQKDGATSGILCFVSHVD